MNTSKSLKYLFITLYFLIAVVQIIIASALFMRFSAFSNNLYNTVIPFIDRFVVLFLTDALLLFFFLQYQSFCALLDLCIQHPMFQMPGSYCSA